MSSEDIVRVYSSNYPKQFLILDTEKGNSSTSTVEEYNISVFDFYARDYELIYSSSKEKEIKTIESFMIGSHKHEFVLKDNVCCYSAEYYCLSLDNNKQRLKDDYCGIYRIKNNRMVIDFQE